MLGIQTTNPMRGLFFKIVNGRGEQILFHLFLLTFMCLGAPHLVHAVPIPDEPQVVDHITIQFPENGKSLSYTLPIFQSGEIRFLSAGVGVDERNANYPSFPLKLIFAQHHGAFLSNVSVAIEDAEGKQIFHVSEDQVTGPWLFLDLLPGTYRIIAIRRDGVTTERTIRARKDPKVVYFHWPPPKGANEKSQEN